MSPGSFWENRKFSFSVIFSTRIFAKKNPLLPSLYQPNGLPPPRSPDSMLGCQMPWYVSVIFYISRRYRLQVAPEFIESINSKNFATNKSSTCQNRRNWVNSVKTTCWGWISRRPKLVKFFPFNFSLYQGFSTKFLNRCHIE